MKNKIPGLFVTLIFAMTMGVSDAFPQSSVNLLLLNGRPFDLNHFPDVSKGILTFLKGDSKSTKAPRVLFYAYLKRAGKIVNSESYAHKHAVDQIEIAELLKSAKAGDVLIIDPANPKDKVERKAITVIHTPVLPVFQWFYVKNKNEKDC